MIQRLPYSSRLDAKIWNSQYLLDYAKNENLEHLEDLEYIEYPESKQIT